MSTRDIDILRLLRWCRFIPTVALKETFSQTELANLASAGLIKKHTGSGACILTEKGHRLLDDALESDVLPQMQKSYRETDIQRRLYIAQMTLTAYRAGLNVFTTELGDLLEGPALFLPSNSRGRGTNPWANTRIAAVAHLGETVYALHHIRQDAGKLLFADELAAFTRNVSILHGSAQAFLFAGDSYGEILSELERSEDTDGDRLICYAEAYRRLRMKAHLLSIDDVGALQLRIMSQPGYREQLTRIALKAKYTPPPKEFPDCDALFDGAPFLLAADMDLRRIDAAVIAARERGCRPVVLAALEAQAEAVLYSRYRDTGRARVFTLTEQALKEFLGNGATLYDPSHEQFVTAKGEVIDAPLIQTHRKTGR